MTPPTEVKVLTDSSFHYKIPVNENALGYEEWTFGLLESFADLYEIDLQYLFDLLSLSLETIRKEAQSSERIIELKKAMLAHGS